MKKIILISFLCLILAGCFAEYKDYNLLVAPSDGDDCEFVEVANELGQIIKTYCLDEVKLKMTDGTLNDISVPISAGDVTIENLLSVLEKKEVLYDGGTTIYEGEDYNIFKCQNMAGVNDIIIARKDIEFKEEFCEK